MQALLIILIILAYLAISGACMKAFYVHRACRHSCIHDHTTSSFFFGVLWPASVPIIAGSMAGSLFEPRDERLREKRRRELEEARHETDMARERAMKTEWLEVALK